MRAHINKTRDTRARRVCVKDGAPRSITGQPFLRHYSESSASRRKEKEKGTKRDNEPEKSGVRFSGDFLVIIGSISALVCSFGDTICHRLLCFFIREEGFFLPLLSSSVSYISCQIALGLLLSSDRYLKQSVLFFNYAVVYVRLDTNSDVRVANGRTFSRRIISSWFYVESRVTDPGCGRLDLDSRQR